MVFSLQKRFLLLLLLPVTVILIIAGIASFFYARWFLLEEWTALTRLRLENTAHQIQMRLDRQRLFIDLIANADPVPSARFIQAFLIQQLRQVPGISFVDIQPADSSEPQPERTSSPGQMNHSSALQDIPPLTGMDPGAMNDLDRASIGLPSGNEHGPMHTTHGMGMHRTELSFNETGKFLVISRTFEGTADRPAKRIEVSIAFNSFMKGILDEGHWEQSYACLVKPDGAYLAHTDSSMRGFGQLGETGDVLEKRVLEEMENSHFGTVRGKGHPPDRVIGFYKVPSTDWYLVVVAKGSAVLAPIAGFRFYYSLAGILSLICVGALIHWNTRPIARSVKQISTAAEEVEKGNYSLRIPEDRSDEIGMLKRRFNRMTQGLRDRDLIEQTFGRYVDRRIAAELMARPESFRMGGKHQVVTILMADLRGFTQISQSLKPSEVIRIINRHFSKMIEVIERYKGIIVDFYGDSVLVFFDGADEDVSSRALDAVKCGAEMQDELKSVSERNREEGLPELAMGIGIHTGEVIVGNIGSETRAKYGIVGSAVNETDRIQSFARSDTIVISGATYELLSNHIVVGPKFQASLKGFDEARDLYEVKDTDALSKR